MLKFTGGLKYIPWFVMLIFNLAAIFLLATIMFSEGNIEPKIKAVFLISLLFLAILIFLLRITAIGKTTPISKFFTSNYGMSALIFLASINVSTIIVTSLIKHLKIDFFISGFNKDPAVSPLEWLDYTNNNFNKLALYCLAWVAINYFLIYLFLLMEKYLKRWGVIIDNKPNNYGSSKKSDITELSANVIGYSQFVIIAILFGSNTMARVWQLLTAQSITNNILNYLFGGSLLLFDLYFLVRKN